MLDKLYVTIKSNDIVVFAAISPVSSSLNADSMVPARRPFWKRFWPPDLSIQPSVVTNTYKRTAVASDRLRRLFHSQVAQRLTSQNYKKNPKQVLFASLSAKLGPQLAHHPRDTICPLDWCLGFEHRSWVGNARNAPLYQWFCYPYIL